MITRRHTSQGINALKGFLSGSLIIGGAINPYSLPVQAILFLIGLVMLLDAYFLYGKDNHPATTSFLALFGAVFSTAFTLLGYAAFYLAVMLFVTALVYAHFYVTRKGAPRHQEG